MSVNLTNLGHFGGICADLFRCLGVHFGGGAAAFSHQCCCFLRLQETFRLEVIGAQANEKDARNVKKDPYER